MVAERHPMAVCLTGRVSDWKGFLPTSNQHRRSQSWQWMHWGSGQQCFLTGILLHTPQCQHGSAAPVLVVGQVSPSQEQSEKL